MGQITVYGIVFKSDAAENLMAVAHTRSRTSDPLVRRKMARQMRGGKWRRGRGHCSPTIVFTVKEQEQIFKRLAEERRKLSGMDS